MEGMAHGSVADCRRDRVESPAGHDVSRRTAQQTSGPSPYLGQDAEAIYPVVSGRPGEDGDDAVRFAEGADRLPAELDAAEINSPGGVCSERYCRSGCC